MTIDILNMNSPEWMDRGKCAGRPAENDPVSRRNYGRSVDVQWIPDGAKLEPGCKRSCVGCPVINECLSYALERPELEGIWGGTTTAERAGMRKGAA